MKYWIVIKYCKYCVLFEYQVLEELRRTTDVVFRKRIKYCLNMKYWIGIMYCKYCVLFEYKVLEELVALVMWYSESGSSIV